MQSINMTILLFTTTDLEFHFQLFIVKTHLDILGYYAAHFFLSRYVLEEEKINNNNMWRHEYTKYTTSNNYKKIIPQLSVG
jgi:hypothetical protein